MWISFCKKYLQYQGVLGIKITASTAVLYSTGIGMLNASFSRSLNMFWNQSWSTYKRITSINGTQLNKTDVYSPPPKKNPCLPRVVKSFYKCLTEASGTFTGFFLIKIQW